VDAGRLRRMRWDAAAEHCSDARIGGTLGRGAAFGSRFEALATRRGHLGEGVHLVIRGRATFELGQRGLEELSIALLVSLACELFLDLDGLVLLVDLDERLG